MQQHDGGNLKRVLVVFFPAHPKCQLALERAINSTQPSITVRSLKDLLSHMLGPSALMDLTYFRQHIPSCVPAWNRSVLKVLGTSQDIYSQMPEPSCYL